MWRSLTKGGLTALALSVSTTCLAACATQQSATQNTEQMLAAAGFIEKPADTPRRQQHLAALPPYRVLSQRVHIAGNATMGYIYADPQFCHCVFVGSTDAYAHFQQMAFQQHLADEQIAAQEMAEQDTFGWGDWGPYPYWGGGEVIVGGGGFRGGGFHGGGFHR